MEAQFGYSLNMDSILNQALLGGDDCYCQITVPATSDMTMYVTDLNRPPDGSYQYVLLTNSQTDDNFTFTHLTDGEEPTRSCSGEEDTFYLHYETNDPDLNFWGEITITGKLYKTFC